MNTLSWFFYFANTLPAMSGMFFGFGFCLLGAVLIYNLFISLNNQDEPENNHKPYLSYWWIVLSVIFFTLASLIPSERTIYMIAASEVGEMVVTSPSSQDMFEDLKKIINNYANEVE